jgi:hypothetical protein
MVHPAAQRESSLNAMVNVQPYLNPIQAITHYQQLGIHLWALLGIIAHSPS